MTVATAHDSIHPPHRESWDAGTGSLVNRYGHTRTLSDHLVTGFGLYARRMFEAHTRAAGQAVWLLPELGIRVISWIPQPGVEDLEDFYIDIADIAVDGGTYQLVDQYLDILVWTGQRADVVDQDEFVEAITAGHLDDQAARSALAASYRTLEGLARHQYRLHTWLRKDHGIDLVWPGHSMRDVNYID